jgi:hypothetical protein
MANFKIKNKNFFEAGGKREASGDDKLTIFFMGPYLELFQNGYPSTQSKHRYTIKAKMRIVETKKK